jgi:hypothetical protein
MSDIACSSRLKYTIQDIQILANKKKGICLSKEYTGIFNKLLWECEFGHQWEANFHSIKSGSWCPICALKIKGNKKYTILDIKKYAKNIDIICLSDKYINYTSKLKLMCNKNHIFFKSFADLKQSNKCPICSSDGLGERLCRSAFEQLFNKKFPKNYPKWLRTNEGNALELDGYNEELGIAFEHQGQQHYKYNKFFHGSLEDFEKQKERDILKKELCQKNNVKLIIVPEIPKLLKLKNLKKYLINELNKYNIHLNYKYINFNFLNVFSTNKDDEILNTIKEIAENKNGKCLSSSYKGDRIKLKFQCEKGHTFYSSPNKIKQNQWCPICNGTKKYTLQEIQKFAKKHNLKLLSNNYLNNKSKLLWECVCGNQWYNSFNKIKQGRRCPKCAPKRIHKARRIFELKKVKEYLDIYNISFSENEYINCKTFLNFKCINNHTFSSSYFILKKRKHKCPYCKKLKRKK